MGEGGEVGATSGRLVVSVVVSATLLLSAEAALVLLVQLYLKGLGASPLIISVSGSLAWVGTLLASPFWGILGDRASPRRLLSVVLLGTGLATSSLAILPAAPLVLILGTVRRVLVPGLPPIGMKLISTTSRDLARGRNLSYLSAARAAGFVFGGILSGLLLERIGFRGAFLVTAILPVIALPMMGWIPTRPTGAANGATRRAALRALWRSPLRLLYAGVTLRQAATTGVGALAFVYMAEHAVAPETMGFIGAINPAVAVAGTLLFGHFVDRIDRSKVILFGFAVAVLYPLGYVFASGAAGFALAAVPLGLSFGSYYAGTTAAIGASVPQDQQGVMFGLLDASRGLGGLVGPILAGSLVTAFGYSVMFWAMTGISAVAFVLVFTTVRASRSTAAASR
jgi:MFS family permease